MALIRLAYASEATFAASAIEKGIEPNVARILVSSRRNNPRHGLVGGLYYGDSCFFQYLEGEEEAVRQLYEKIRKDSRHRNVTTLLDEPLTERTFTDWSMKYVPVAGDVSAFLARNGLRSFNPFEFNATHCEEMVRLIRESSHDGKVGDAPGGDSAPGHKAPGETGMRNALIAVAVVLGVVLLAGGLLLF